MQPRANSNHSDSTQDIFRKLVCSGDADSDWCYFASKNNTDSAYELAVDVIYPGNVEPFIEDFIKNGNATSVVRSPETCFKVIERFSGNHIRLSRECDKPENKPFEKWVAKRIEARADKTIGDLKNFASAGAMVAAALAILFTGYLLYRHFSRKEKSAECLPIVPSKSPDNDCREAERRSCRL